jgi:hypothetical protein
MYNTIQEFNAALTGALSEGRSLNVKQMVKDLLPKYPNSKKKQDIVTDMQNHLANSGFPVNQYVADRIVTDALAYLKKNSEADNTKTGFWHKLK